ncbi:MAG: S41 family peptidase [Actinomycetes bacterium]|nr:S41 family peptidase [Actinomycetes bacterium]
MNRATKITIAVLGAVAIAFTFFIGGFFFSQAMLARGNNLRAETSELTGSTAEVYRMMQAEALEPPDETTATVGALNGLLKSNGDRYARYLPPVALESYDEDMSGEFGGIGVLLGEKNDTAYVVQVYPDTPAERAGIKAEDYFYGIDGDTRDSWTTEEIQQRVRGKVGTEVEIELLRPWPEDQMPSDAKYVLGEPYTVTLKRDKIQSPNTETKLLSGKVGYVRLYEFNRKATDELRSEYEGLIQKGATSLILDLRENPGGDLQEAVGVSSLFVKSGVIVQIESRGTSKPELLNATGKTLTKELPLVCLVDANSASASEIVAGALQDYDRAVLVGTVTFGKGSVQTQFPYREGAVFMTTAHYLTGKGRVINEVGNTPDVEVPMAVDKQSDQATDTQLQRALTEARKLAAKE